MQISLTHKAEAVMRYFLRNAGSLSRNLSDATDYFFRLTRKQVFSINCVVFRLTRKQAFYDNRKLLM